MSICGVNKESSCLLFIFTPRQRCSLYVFCNHDNESDIKLFYKVPKTGLKTPFRDGLLRHVAEEVLKLAKDGLERRGFKEVGFLNAVSDVVSTGVTPAEKLLELYHGKWGRSIDPVFEELLY